MLTPPPLPIDITNNNISKVRIYRTVVSADSADFFFVVELPAATTTYADTNSNDTVASHEIMASTDWIGLT